MKKKCFRSLLFMIAMTSLFACSSDGPDVIEGEETTTVRVSPDFVIASPKNPHQRV